MKFASVLLGAATTLFAGVVNAEEAVVALTDASFDDHVAKFKFNLVELYAPWCGHCKSLAPEYEKAAQHFKEAEVDGGLSIIKIDATEEKELATRFGVTGFPTLKWMVNGEISDYGGGRTKDEIVAWINKKTGPPAKDIADAAALDAFKESATVVVFGYFADKESDAAKAFLDAAQTDDEASYGISSDAAVGTAAGLSADGVVLFRQFEAPDEPRVECEGEITKDSVKQCVSANILPLVIPFSQQNAPKIFGGSIKQHCLVFLDNGADHKEEVMTATRNVATKNKGEYLFVTVDKSDDRILEFFGLKEDDLPAARIVVMGEGAMKKYALEAEGVPEADLEKFVTAHKAGELKQNLKSEEEKEEHMAEPVKVLVGKSHDRIALDETKNVLVEYYAPWCGHCKKLAPEYEKLGEHFKDDENVIIAKMDSTANEVETVSVSGFPTLKFYPAGSQDIVDFDGGRDFDGMKKFIDENRK